jgi:hypothetical protein
LIACGLALPFAAHATGTRTDLLERALKAAGGRARLSRVKALTWNGNAQVFAGDRTLKIEVATRVEPFKRARSETALAGTTDKRVLIIEPDGGFVERAGTRTALPPGQAEHERQQYGLYGYMLLAQAPTRAGGDRLIAQRAGWPPISFMLEGDLLVAADYAVRDPQGNGTVAQRILLEGEVSDHGVRWPRTITILHNAKPYFILDVERFAVEFD